MTRIGHRVLAGAAALAVAACSEPTGSGTQETSLTTSFLAALTGYSQAQSSFADGTNGGLMAGPLGGGPGRHRGDGFGLMGGGLGLEFFGGGRFGPGFGRGPFGESGLIGVCTFSAATGRISCDPVTFNGITVVRSVAYANAAGEAQSAFDSTTNSVNARTSVSGTVVGAFGRRHGPHHGEHRGAGGPSGPGGTGTSGAVTNDTTTLQHTSDRTVTGLAQGSTQRTVNGTSAGTETTVGTDSLGRFTITRVAGDTTTGVVIPVQSSGFAFPTAGTVVRSMKVTLTYTGQSPQTSSRREVITYNGSNSATVTITQDGTTTTCTLPLPRGRLSCQ